METLDVVRAWKQPELRAELATTHPVGEIMLWQTGGLARRADLLSGYEAFADTSTYNPIETSVSAPAITDEELW